MNDSDISYDSIYEDEVCEKEEVVQFAFFAVPIFFSVVITLSLVGNLLVLVILALYENLKSLTNILILNLAVSDLLFTSGLPFWTIYHMWGWVFHKAICKIVTFVFFIGFYSSLLFLTVMTVYRYLTVVHPLSDLRPRNVTVGVLVSVLLWIVSIGAAVPSLLFSTVVSIPHKDKPSLGCEYEDDLWATVGVSQQNLFFLVASAVVAFCYCRILVRITRTRSHTKTRVVKLVLCIVAVFFLGWVPYNVAIFLRLLSNKLVPPFEDCDTSIRLDYAFYVCRLVAFSHCCLNPVFYALVGVRFRGHLKKMFCERFRGPSTVESKQGRIRNFISQGSMY
ncbi:chemokine (C motif) receptor 1a, duplicate 1 [Syngnathoides biaculeatus]|uniref:chemokine (C motif) receptor 1a, duplicate 1 n=1 Tax=Syngnathoides biaculeatus TaxID=300417 RepID=UPI002ADE271A|nr:chemokine (C motif) receptor 1a, duplicate 1 [Syngnathoides biaculeatus]XP_061680540.1 chemokine (C motif) receptor 1a, duplicate 1 [Syngnathoides biaculeatus]XP_061680541.1 chemokine (C motif) receptor 1a, duplicate 1 [Syngnathoides biaculeatus]XP_061680542.1 chemokine (C motif) receptor 1a, duplicate 1 [Syngnathoides biaculeatus]XP_061680543.1 chemokine (C motif) receptor 1a, duplicate 1 [Syngnathoides biaculeatus]